MIEIPFLFSWRNVSRGKLGEFQYPLALISCGRWEPEGVRYFRILLPIWRRFHNTQWFRHERQLLRVCWTSRDGWFVPNSEYAGRVTWVAKEYREHGRS